MSRTLTRFHSDERGGSFAEAVIVLPAFILVWSLIIFVRNGYENAADAGVQVRRAAFAHSQAGCDGDAGVTVEETNLWGGAVSSAAALLRGGTGWVDIVHYQPLVLSEAGMLLNPPNINNYSVSESVDRPAALGGSARYGHQLALTCDEKPSDYTLEAWIATSWAIVLAEVL